jgi:hypothetical protein
LSDALGSTLALTDSAGISQTTHAFEPFGSATIGGAGTANTFGYNGRELDLSNLYFYRARHSGGGNLYAYVDNDPINYGLKVKPDPPDNYKPRPCVDQSYLNDAAKNAVLKQAADRISMTGVKPDFEKGNITVGPITIDHNGKPAYQNKDWPTYQGTLQVPGIKEWKEQKELAKKTYDSYKSGKEVNDALQRATDNAFRNCTPQ